MKQVDRSSIDTPNRAAALEPNLSDELRKVVLATRSLSVREGVAAWNQAVARYTERVAECLDAARDLDAVTVDPKP